MRIRISLLSLLFSLLTTGFLVSNTQIAVAGCRDYPESVTPACAAQNLAEEQARQAAAIVVAVVLRNQEAMVVELDLLRKKVMQ